MHLILSYFDQIIGPRFHLTSHPHLAEYIESSVVDLMDIKTERGFFEYNYYSDEYEVFLANFYFEIPSTWARGNHERVMLTLVVDPIQNPVIYRSILEKYANKIQNTPNIFKGFYSFSKEHIKNDPEVQEKQDILEHLFEQLLEESINSLSKILLGEILVVGLSFVGKTSYLNVLNQKAFNDNIKPTLGIQITRVVLENYRLNAIDVGGQSKLNTLYQKVKYPPLGIIFMVDITSDKNQSIEARNMFQELIKHYFGEDLSGYSEKPIPILILGNKIDLDRKFDKNRIKTWLDFDGSPLIYKIFTTSALKNVRVYSSFRWLVAQLVKNAE